MLTTIVHWLAAQIQTLRTDSERGASAVEYGLLVGLIAVAIIATVTLLGEELNAMFNRVVDALSGTASSSS